LKANEAAGGHADYTARIKVLRQKTGMQQKVAKVWLVAGWARQLLCSRLECCPIVYSCRAGITFPQL
jgi:hypothetical protein